MTEENVAIQTNQQTYQEMDQLNVMDESTPDNDAQTFKNKSHSYLRSVRCQSLICPQEIQFTRPLLKHPHPWQTPSARYQSLE